MRKWLLHSEPSESETVIMATDEARALAAQVHADGFVALASNRFRVPLEQVAAVRSAVLQQYEQLLSQATDSGIDLSLSANAEVVPGFYVRQGGRIDMQLKRAALGLAAAKTDQALLDCEAQVTGMASIWADVVSEIFCSQDDKDAKYALEYVGCVLARPGDADQNWHLDGVHRNAHVQEPGTIDPDAVVVCVTDSCYCCGSGPT